MRRRFFISTLTSQWRFYFLILGFCSFYFLLVFNLYDIQFNKRAVYETLAENQQLASGALAPFRGNIYFTDKNNGKIQAAINKDYLLVYAVPKEAQQQNFSSSSARFYAEKLSSVLGVPVSEIEKKLNNKGSLFERLLVKASDAQAQAIKDLNLKGIYAKKQTERFYPNGTLASNLLGFVGFSDEGDDLNSQTGRYGIEKFFEKNLKGAPGKIDGDKIVSPRDGDDLYLTIDMNIQTQAEEILKKLIDQWQATGGNIIVQEPATGKILALADIPDFDPNNYSQYPLENFKNPAVQSLYEPGSVFKLFTMSAGIDSGKIMPETSYVDTGSVVLNGRKIQNSDQKVWGKQTMTGVIEHSINTGSIFAEQKTGHNIFSEYLQKFGLLDLTGVPLPSEIRGNFSNLKSGRDVNFATASFGQGVSMTPLRLISSASAIANNGVLMKPIILAGEKSEVVRRVISEETAKKVVQMMVSAVKVNKLADIPNYTVAGKTGTAYIADLQRGGYTKDVNDTYLGFAPAFAPRFIILVKMEKPKNAPLAGLTVVPAFRELAEFILNYYNVEPDRAGNN